MKKLIALTMVMGLMGGFVRAEEAVKDDVAQDCEAIEKQWRDDAASMTTSIKKLKSNFKQEEDSTYKIGSELASINRFNAAASLKDGFEMYIKVVYRGDGSNHFELSPAAIVKVQNILAEEAQIKTENLKKMIAAHKAKYPK